MATVLAGTMLLSGADTGRADAPRATFAERFHAGLIVPDCSMRSWPYLAAECLRTADGTRARPARIIAIDRRISSDRAAR